MIEYTVFGLVVNGQLEIAATFQGTPISSETANTSRGGWSRVTAVVHTDSVEEAERFATQAWNNAHMGAHEYPRVWEGRVLWACCESTIGPVCEHRTEPTS